MQTLHQRVDDSRRRGWEFLAIFATYAGGAAAAAFSCAALLGWILGQPLLASIKADLIPMAPSTAVLLLLLGVAICWRARTPLRIRTYWVNVVLGWLVMMTALLLFALSSLDLQWSFEHFGLPITGSIGNAALGHMSPLTAFCFLLAGLSFLASLSRSAIPAWRTLLALGTAGVLLGTCLPFLLAYLYSAPLLYGGPVIPPALNTILAFMLLGLALLALVNRPTALPPQVLERDFKTSFSFALIFIALAAGIVTTGYFYYQRYTQRYRSEVERQLSAIAELKADELMQWREERLGDGSILFKNTLFSTLVRHFFEKSADADAQRQLQTWLDKIQNHYQYDRVFLLDTQGVTRISAPAAALPSAALISRRVPEILRFGQIAFQDFYRNERDQRVYLAILIPVLDEADGGRPLGVLVLNIDPTTYLYPFLQRWPIPSQSAETVLLRRDDNDALFLSETKIQTNAALNLRISLKNNAFPVMQAALGKTGIVEGQDYYGCPALAYVRAIPDSPWFLMARIASAEVYAPLQERLWQMVVLINALLLGAGAGVGVIWRHQRLRFYQEQAETMAALHASEDKYKTLFDSARDAIMTIEPPSWRFTSGNPATLKIFGAKTEDEFIAHGPWDLSPERQPDGRSSIEKAKAMIETALRKGSHFFEWTHRRLTGEEFPAAVLLSRVQSAKKVFLQAAVRDITEQRHALESQARLVTAVEQSPETIMITAPSGKIVYVNPAFEKITGYTRAEAYGQNPRILKSGKHEAAFYRQMWTTLTAGKVWSGHLINKRKDHTLYEEEATISPVFEAAGKIVNYVAVKRDVTHEVALEEQNRQAAKMEAVGQLAGGVAHDFNNMLQIIMGHVEMLLQVLPPEHPLRPDLLEIQNAARRSADLTRQLLAFSRKQAITPIMLDINTAISGSLKMLKRLIGENILLRFTPQPQSGRVFMDPGQVNQILVNLVVNARDAISGTGTISIAAAPRTLLAADCRDKPDFVPPGDYVLLTFHDDGAGMTPEIQAHLFEPFFTTKGIGKGTGLGLATVYGIVKQNHGAITVQSAPQQGTTFTIYLPLANTTDVAKEEQAAERVPTGTETVLVVEDEAPVLNLVQWSLAQLGYTVLTASTAADALHFVEQYTGPIHLLLTDVIMPEQSGKDAAECIQKLRPGIRILYMSGYPADILEQYGHLPADLHVLQKPFSAAALAQQVRATLDTPPV
ncbi:MAG: PAS domain S-box protein [Verrucomicrobia bacterium]|nr:MAG: PAS domain S-box protein [Verrucomicrobiota bacterium]